MKRTLISTAVSMVLATIYGHAAAQAAAPEQASSEPSAADAKAGNAQLSTVVVTGFRSSLEKSLVLKQQAIGVRDSIVAEDIGKFPESNVAESLQRIPGIYVSRDAASNEGQRISIRGLGPQYSVTTINGAPVRTTSSTNVGNAVRDFNYDVFASDLFGRVDFYKTPVAELDEGGIGGVVDLQTPRPFDSKGRVIRYAASESYNDSSQKFNPKYSFIASDTWGSFGALIGYAHSGSTNMQSGFESTGSYAPAALARTTAPAGYSIPFSFDFDYADPRANLGNLTKAQVDNALMPRFFRAKANRNVRERDGLVTSLQYKSGAWDVSADGLFSKMSDLRETHTFGLAIRNSRTTNTAIEAGKPGHNGFVPINVFIDQNGLLQGTFGNTSYLSADNTVEGETRFGLGSLNAKYTVSDKLKFIASAAHSSSKAYSMNTGIQSNIYGVTSTMDSSQNRVYPVLTSTIDYTDRSKYRDIALSLSYADENDKSDTLRAMAEYKYGLPADWEGTLRVGGSYNSATKVVNKYNGATAAQTQTLPIGGTFRSQGDSLTRYMSQGAPFSNFAADAPSTFPHAWAFFDTAFVNDVIQPRRAKDATQVDRAGSFVTSEDVTSLFASTDLNGEVLDRGLRVNLGVRYARTKTHIDNYKQIRVNNVTQYTPNTLDANYSNILPSFSAAYDLLDNLVVRASGGRTITRAPLSLIAANTTIPDPFKANATTGNPDLKPQISDQLDLAAEWYFRKGSVISAGLFRKQMKDLTQSAVVQVPFSSLGLPDNALGQNLWDPALGKPNPDLPINLSTYFNAAKQNVTGLELAYQQAFTFLPEPFNGLGALASYTRIKWPIPDWVGPDGTGYKVWEVPRYSYNLTAYYERGPWAIRTSYNYRDGNILTSSVRGLNQSLGGMALWQEGRGFLDLSVSYKVSKNLEIRFDAMNLNNQVNEYYYKDMTGSGKYGSDHSRTDNLIYDGRTFMVGIRGSF